MGDYTVINDPGAPVDGFGCIYEIRVDGRARYRGQTIRSLKRRMKYHIRDTEGGGTSYKCNGLRKALREGLAITIEPLLTGVPCGAELDAAETLAIDDLKAQGRCWNTNSDPSRVDHANMSPESKAKISAAATATLTERWKDEEFRAKMAAVNSKLWEDEEYRERMSAAMSAMVTELWENEEYRERMSAAMSAMATALWENEEYREAASQRAKAQWEDEGFRERHSQRMAQQLAELWEGEEYREGQRARMTERWEGEEYRTQMCAMATDLWKDEEYRARMSAARFAQWEDEEYRVWKSQRMTALWEDEEYRARHSQLMTALWEGEEYRTRMIAERSARWKNEEYRELHSQRVSQQATERWKDDGFKARVSTATSESKKAIAAACRVLGIPYKEWTAYIGITGKGGKPSRQRAAMARLVLERVAAGESVESIRAEFES